MPVLHVKFFFFGGEHDDEPVYNYRVAYVQTSDTHFLLVQDYALNTVPHGLRPSYEYVMGLEFLTARYPRGPIPKSKTFKPQTFFNKIFLDRPATFVNS